jgi:hypothetical protein
MMTDASPDTFAAVTTLIKLVVDAKACAKRLDDLQRLADQVAKAQATLDADRGTHHRELATAEAVTNAREAKLRDREVKVAIAERDLAAREKVIADARPPRFYDDPNLGPGGRSPSGLTRNPL